MNTYVVWRTTEDHFMVTSVGDMETQDIHELVLLAARIEYAGYEDTPENLIDQEGYELITIIRGNVTLIF